MSKVYHVFGPTSSPKYRLKKKFNLEADDDFNAFLEGIEVIKVVTVKKHLLYPNNLII